MPSQPVRCDIFCQIVDHFGDAGVCWRLARQLADEFDWKVRLFVDQPRALARIEPTYDGATVQEFCRGVDVLHWAPGTTWGDLGSFGDVVIAAFGCRLPSAYRTLMATLPQAPVWLNLEYLSAEQWVEGCHALPSPDPLSGMVQFFFFPGFSARTGGLLRECWQQALLEQYSERRNRQRFLETLGVSVSLDEVWVSVFCYPKSPIASLIETRHPVHRVRWLIPELVAGQADLSLVISQHSDAVSIIPFLPQDDYDRLLGSCDVNFVRGEDSFVRAHWATRPFVWQAYRQEGDTHKTKVTAFLNCYLDQAAKDVRSAIEGLWGGWNEMSPLTPGQWLHFLDQKEAIEAHNQAWEKSLKKQGHLAGNLVDFCNKRL